MLDYAAGRPVAGASQPSPQVLLLIISIHVALLAIVMSAKMDLPRHFPKAPPTIIDWVPDPTPPPPNVTPRASSHPAPLSNPRPIVENQPLQPPPIATNPIDPGAAVGGGGAGIIPSIPQPNTTAQIHHDPRLLTSPSELKPPYPADKLLSEEEAVLTLRLTIDEHGRVVDVQPVGRADRSFLDAARRHLLAHWRYQPAMDDSRAVASSVVVTLRFQLDG
jgi:protein TonB